LAYQVSKFTANHKEYLHIKGTIVKKTLYLYLIPNVFQLSFSQNAQRLWRQCVVKKQYVWAGGKAQVVTRRPACLTGVKP
jgi:hypothetical protein